MLSPCNGASSVPAPAPTPIVWSSAPARRISLESQPLGFDAAGEARWLVRVRFLDAHGGPTKLAQAGDVEFNASRGTTQWQTRTRFGGPAVIVRTADDGALAVRAIVRDPGGIADARGETDTRAWSGARTVAQALGPHLVQVGWFPAAREPVVVSRGGNDGTHIVCTLSAASSTCRDRTVEPGRTYRFTVERASKAVALDVRVPEEGPQQTLEALRGKGMWLRFSPDRRDDDSYLKLNAGSIVARAKGAGVRFIELRLSYGEFWEVTPEAKPVVDALIDAAVREGIAVIGWVVPRALTPEDLATAVAAASYRTARGNGMAGVALDLERGSDYLGEGDAAKSAIAEYSTLTRQALGSKYLIAGIVEDPYLSKLTNADYPFSRVAAQTDALQPMAYWRMFRQGIGGSATRAVTRQSIVALRSEAGRAIVTNFGGQTLGLGPCGAPTPQEIVESLRESKRAGAIGETFFDWFGTGDAQWDAISSFSW
jgi:hypothetical protein